MLTPCVVNESAAGAVIAAAIAVECVEKKESDAVKTAVKATVRIMVLIMEVCLLDVENARLRWRSLRWRSRMMCLKEEALREGTNLFDAYAP